jgi:hypothetical protein
MIINLSGYCKISVKGNTEELKDPKKNLQVCTLGDRVNNSLRIHEGEIGRLEQFSCFAGCYPEVSDMVGSGCPFWKC